MLRNTVVKQQLFCSLYLSLLFCLRKLRNVANNNNDKALCKYIFMMDIFFGFSIFKRGSDIRRYQDFLDKLNTLRTKSLKVRAVLSYILLFDCTDDESAEFRSWPNVNMDDLHILNLVMFQNCKAKNNDESLSLEDFIRTLREMSIFFANNVSWKEFELATSPSIELSFKVSNSRKHMSSQNIFFKKILILRDYSSFILGSSSLPHAGCHRGKDLTCQI